jgi:AraC family transcriptional regulator
LSSRAGERHSKRYAAETQPTGRTSSARKIKQPKAQPRYIRKNMTARLRQLHPVLKWMTANLDRKLSLQALAERAGLSAFHLHRVFSAVAGETPKQFTLRLRLGRAAVLLLTGRESVLNIALACGFESHEVFCRMFRRRYGMTPSAYRARGFAMPVTEEQARFHAGLVAEVGPCIGLYHIKEQATVQRDAMEYSITKKQLEPQPVLAVRRRVARPELATALGEVYGRVYAHVQQNGIAMAGAPYARYLEMGTGLWTIEAGLPVIAPSGGEGDIAAGTLPGGLVAMTVHAGSYDQLHEAHAAIQKWMDKEGLRSAGAPWESYVTDPGTYPDPKDWKTEVFWPVAAG